VSKLTSKCGMDCGTCPWGPYPRQNMTAEEFGQYKKRAKEILGYTPMKTPCPTCQTLDEEIPKGSKLPPRNCLVRQCVDKTGIENCAYCSRFPCEQAKDTSGAWNRQKFEELRQDGWVVDTQKAKEKLGFSPQYSLKEAIHETIDWYTTNNWL